MRWKCVCAYDGTAFSGWQSQAAGNSVQDAIESQLGRVFGAPIRIHGSGRTDSGVHARGQVFHFDAEWRHGAEKMIAAFRTGLPPSIQIKSVRPAPADFHARFDARGKIYSYEVRFGDADPFTRPFCWPVFRPLDIRAMSAAARVLRGRHDFKAFSAIGRPDEGDSRRNLRRLEVRKRGRRVRIVAEADGFLYKMVRSLVGTLVAVGEGKLTLSDVRALLRSGKRTPQVQTAPARGLFLERVTY